ncbi:MAG: hypothetical protein E7046_11675 [Lentisphaerae bacterium]|nr:hypothetical protein [Lentisphaerota bacterium]
MRTVKAGVVLENAVRMAGFEPATMAVPVRWRMLAAMAVNNAFQKIAAEKFPQMKRVEFRRYRPTWQPDVGWRERQECWWNGAYWRLETAKTGAGATEPSAAESCPWRMLKMDEVSAFIEYDQPWEGAVIEPGGVDVQEFAYTDDPKYCPDAAPIKGCRASELGIVIPSPAPEGVWVRFIPQPTEISFTEWTEEDEYQAGDVVYLTSRKESYVATGEPKKGIQPAADAESWMPVRISTTWLKYLTLVAATEIMTAEQGRYQTEAAANGEFDRLCERYLAYGGENDANMGGYC